MISQSIIEDYKKIFILCLEVAGEKTGDKLLLHVERHLDDQLIYSIISDLSKTREICMGEIICIMLSTILIPKIFGKNSISAIENMDLDANSLDSFSNKIKKVSDEAADIYFKYLKIASEKFCKTRGIDLSIDFSDISKSNIVK